jgi:MoaA/NifB/PqqE/SkfB family radical SAM enzyme
MLRITGLNHSSSPIQSAYGMQVRRPAEAGLPLSVWESFAGQVGWTKPHLIVCGGEPLLYAEVDKLLAILHGSGATLELLTDGLKLDAHLEPVRKHVETLHVMLLGFGESHDHYFGQAGAFKTVRRNLEAIRGQPHAPKLTLTYTFLPQNVQDVPEFLDWALSLGAAVTLQHPQYGSANLSHMMAEAWKRYYGYEFDRESLPVISDLQDPLFGDDVADACQTAREEYASRMQLRIYPDLDDQDIRSYYSDYDHVFMHDKRVCVKPWQFPTVEPRGDFTLCHNYAVGNIADTRFWTAWNGAPAAQFRRNLMRVERFPMCTRCAFLYRDMDELKAVIDKE